MLEFKEPTIEDRLWVNELVEREGGDKTLLSYDVAFGTNFVWRGMYHIKICRYRDFVLKTFGKDEKTIRYAVPVGQGDMKEALGALMEDARERGLKPCFGGVTKEQMELLEACFPGDFTFREDRDYFEYIYLTEDLAELKGRKYHGKRNHISKFKNQYDYTFELINNENKKDALLVSKLWCEQNVLGGDNGLTHEICAIREAFRYFDELGFQGAVIKIDGKPVAMTAGERVCNDVFVVHFEKALPGYDGLYAAINNFFARELTGYKYINREEDLGIEGLRRAKLSYRPTILLEEYEGCAQ